MTATTSSRSGQRPATDDPDVFDLNAAAAEAKHEAFHFKYGPKDEVWALAPILDIDYRDLEAADSGDVEAVRDVLCDRMEAHEEGQWQQFDELDLPVGVLDQLFRAWLKHNGLQPGESLRSSEKSGRTGGRSRRRSRAKGSR